MPVDDKMLMDLDETGKKMDALTGKEPGGPPGGPPAGKPAKSSGDPDLDMAIDGAGFDPPAVNCLKRIAAKLDDASKAIMKKELGGKSDPGMMDFIGKNGGFKDDDFEDVKMGDEEPSGEMPKPPAGMM